MITIYRFWCPKGYTYDPGDVVRWLAKISPSPKRTDEKNAELGICTLYRKLGHNIAENNVAGGVRELLANAEHASNIIIQAYAQKWFNRPFGRLICYSFAMQKEDLQKKKLPDAPGVYFFLGPKKKILYIGKATSLRNRVRSYFAADIKEKRSELIEKMVREAKTVEVTETDSVLEALILETNLIRTHKPLYNTRSKDDKSYNHLVITDEEFPRVLVVRGKDLTEKFQEDEIKYHFGPFPSGSLFREALKIVRRLFKFYDTKVPLGQEKSKLAKGKIDFNRQIGLYPDVQSKKEYAKTLRHIRLFLKVRKVRSLKSWKRKWCL